VKKVLLDSGILNAYVGKRAYAFDKLIAMARQGIRLGTCTPVLAEFYFGLEMSQSRERNAETLARSLATLRIWNFDIDASRRYGELATVLRRSGRPMQSIDLMLASVALSIGNCTVITTDSDLESVPGLSVERWIPS
jgi:tRNA(fMet)-specific endonuclease VapC